MRSIARLRFLQILFILCTTACSRQPSAIPTPASQSLTTCFPSTDAVPGWMPVTEAAVYDKQNIFMLVDGQAATFLAYGFEQVAVQRYRNAAGVQVNNEVWQLPNPKDAYGLFTTSQAGRPAAIGNDSKSYPGHRLIFWQDRYYVAVTSTQGIPDAELYAFARALSGALPSGSERPALVNRLPVEGLENQKWIFFHEEISIQNDLWLGGENLLDLSQQTDGVLARYTIDGVKVRLLLIEYPDAAKASNGLLGLRSGKVTNLVAADTNGSILAAVLGKADQVAAEKLLNATLGK